MDRPSLKLIHGKGALLELLDDVRKRVETGEVNVLGIAFSNTKNEVWHGTAWQEDAPLPWARLLAATATMQDDLVSNGL
jgi:hypothetical protein